MKNWSIYFVLLLFVMGCNEPNTPQREAAEKSEIVKEDNVVKKDIRVFVYDGCQYIIFREQQGSLRGYMSHKGNCNNPIHCYRVVKDSI